ncbi:MAG: hypothetical protein M3Y87_16250 [Myxococcota bacterium]|nr:hypothetical protein [Myxococcota bacterium]
MRRRAVWHRVAVGRARRATTPGNLGRARTLEPGRVEVFAAPEAYAVMSEAGASVRPIGEAGVRVGATRELELEVDARVSTLGVSLGPRVQLHRSADSARGVDVALAPSLSWTYVDKLGLDTALLVGINLGEHQLVLSARLAYQMRVGVGGQREPLSFLYAGGTIGVAIRVDPRLLLMPEVALLTQLTAEPGFSSNLDRAVGMQASLGFLIDL